MWSHSSGWHPVHPPASATRPCGITTSIPNGKDRAQRAVPANRTHSHALWNFPSTWYIRCQVRQSCKSCRSYKFYFSVRSIGIAPCVRDCAGDVPFLYRLCIIGCCRPTGSRASAPRHKPLNRHFFQAQKRVGFLSQTVDEAINSVIFNQIGRKKIKNMTPKMTFAETKRHKKNNNCSLTVKI